MSEEPRNAKLNSVPDKRSSTSSRDISIVLADEQLALENSAGSADSAPANSTTSNVDLTSDRLVTANSVHSCCSRSARSPPRSGNAPAGFPCAKQMRATTGSILSGPRSTEADDESAAELSRWRVAKPKEEFENLKSGVTSWILSSLSTSSSQHSPLSKERVPPESNVIGMEAGKTAAGEVSNEQKNDSERSASSPSTKESGAEQSKSSDSTSSSVSNTESSTSRSASLKKPQKISPRHKHHAKTGKGGHTDEHRPGGHKRSHHSSPHHSSPHHSAAHRSSSAEMEAFLHRLLPSNEESFANANDDEEWVTSASSQSTSTGSQASEDEEDKSPPSTDTQSTSQSAPPVH